MVSTLQELCYNHLAKQMANAPPGIQEMVMGETKKRMEERITQQVVGQHIQQMENILQDIIPDIMEDLIRVTVVPGALRADYTSIYPFTNPSLVQCAVRTAEEAVRRMEERYVHAAFHNQHHQYDDEYDEEDEEDQDSEGMYL